MGRYWIRLLIEGLNQAGVLPGGARLSVDSIQDALNQAGILPTAKALQRVATDGKPNTVGATTLTSKGRLPKDYQTPYGFVILRRQPRVRPRGEERAGLHLGHPQPGRPGEAPGDRAAGTIAAGHSTIIPVDMDGFSPIRHQPSEAKRHGSADLTEAPGQAGDPPDPSPDQQPVGR